MQVLGKTTLAAPYPVVGQAIQSKIIFQSLDASSREYTLPAPYPGGRSEKLISLNMKNSEGITWGFGWVQGE